MVGTFSDESGVYLVDLMFRYTQELPSKMIPIKKIKFFLKWNTWGEKDISLTPLDVIKHINGKRILSGKKYEALLEGDHINRIKVCDTKYPVLIYKKSVNDKEYNFVLIDGYHRLTKMYIKKNELVPCIFFDNEIMKKFWISKLKDQEKVFKLTRPQIDKIYKKRFGKTSLVEKYISQWQTEGNGAHFWYNVINQYLLKNKLLDDIGKITKYVYDFKNLINKIERRGSERIFYRADTRNMSGLKTGDQLDIVTFMSVSSSLVYVKYFLDQTNVEGHKNILIFDMPPEIHMVKVYPLFYVNKDTCVDENEYIVAPGFSAKITATDKIGIYNIFYFGIASKKKIDPECLRSLKKLPQIDSIDSAIYNDYYDNPDKKNSLVSVLPTPYLELYQFVDLRCPDTILCYHEDLSKKDIFPEMFYKNKRLFRGPRKKVLCKNVRIIANESPTNIFTQFYIVLKPYKISGETISNEKI